MDETVHQSGVGRAQGLFAAGVQTALVILVFALVILASRATAGGIGASPFAAESVGGTLWRFLTAFAAVTALTVVVLRTVKGAAFISLLMTLAVFTGIASVTERLFGSSVAILVTSVAVLVHFSAPRVIVRDLLLAGGLAGVALVIGSGLQPVAVVVLLAVLSLYDIVAVYWSGHMIRMAKAFSREGALFAFIVPRRAADLLARTDDRRLGGSVFQLGTGDVVLPALLVASAAGSGRSGLFPAAGALFGLWLTLGLFFRVSRRRPMPALPPVALGAILGYVITILFP